MSANDLPSLSGGMLGGEGEGAGWFSPWCPASEPAGTPSSNHGVLGTRGTLDFLSFTASENSFVARDECRDIEYRARVASPFAEDAMIAVNDVLRWVLPTGALNADVFVNKGRFGYKQSADVFWQGAAKPCGFVARGGNGGTVLVSISGAGMPFIGHPMHVAGALRAHGARITRLDAAFDDFNGEHLDIRELAYEARCGVFQRSNQPPKMRFIDDMGTGAGCSLYIGTKGRTELCIYEKGKEQGDASSPWVRCEARLWSGDRVIPYEALNDPLSVIVGAYPAMSAYLPKTTALVAQKIKRQVEANADEMIAWLSSAAGKSLMLLRESGIQVGLTDSEILNLISRQGTPSRFAGVPEEVVIRRIGEHLKEQGHVES